MPLCHVGRGPRASPASAGSCRHPAWQHPRRLECGLRMHFPDHPVKPCLSSPVTRVCSVLKGEEGRQGGQPRSSGMCGRWASGPDWALPPLCTPLAHLGSGSGPRCPWTSDSAVGLLGHQDAGWCDRGREGARAGLGCCPPRLLQPSGSHAWGRTLTSGGRFPGPFGLSDDELVWPCVGHSCFSGRVIGIQK